MQVGNNMICNRIRIIIAGQDVSEVFATCHKGETTLSKLAVVGIMA